MEVRQGQRDRATLRGRRDGDRLLTVDCCGEAVVGRARARRQGSATTTAGSRTLLFCR